MAEVLGIVSSVLAIGDSTVKIVNYIQGVKDAAAEWKQFAAELEEVMRLLKMLEEKAAKGEIQNLSQSASAQLESGVQKFRKLVEDVGKKLGVEKEGPLSPVKNMAWPFKKEELKEKLDEIERYKSTFNLVLTGAISDAIHLLRQEMLLKPETPRDEGVALAPEDKKWRDILHWLSPLSFKARQDDILAKRTASTGTWLLDHPDFQAWVAGTCTTPHMLCTGIPGAGKSVLASVVIDYLHKRFDYENVAILYIYCAYNEQSTHTVINFIGYLLRQLARNHASKHEKIKAVVTKLYTDCQQEDKNYHPSLNKLCNILNELFQLFANVYLVIDALDECLASESCKLIPCLKGLQLRVLATSRHIPEILNQFEEDVHLEIRANENDLKQYLESKINAEVSIEGVIQGDEMMIRNITEKVVQKADGMFLLAQLHLDSILADFVTRQQIEMALDALPRGFDQTYDKAIKRCAQQSIEKYTLAKRVFTWLTYATRPLNLLELQHALAIQADQGEIATGKLDEEQFMSKKTLVSVCAGLVTFEEKSQSLKLVHFTTQKYFLQRPESLSADAHADIAICCMRHIRDTTPTIVSFGIFESLSIESIHRLKAIGVSEWWDSREEAQRFRSEHPFHVYAINHWNFHTRFGSTAELLKAARTFVHDTRDVLYPAHVLFADIRWDLGERYLFVFRSPDIWGWNRNDWSVPMLVAVAFGLSNVVRSYLQEGIDFKIRDSRKHGTLALAVFRGYTDIALLLLKAAGYIHDSPDTQSGHVANAYDLKPHRFSKWVGKSSLFRNTDYQYINWSDDDGVTALHLVNEPQSFASVLGSGATSSHDRNTITRKNRYQMTPNPSAVELVRLMLACGANFNVRSSGLNWVTPLYCHVRAGRTDVTRLLLDAYTASNITPLQEFPSHADLLCAAIHSSSVETTQILLSKGVDLGVGGRRVLGPVLNSAVSLHGEVGVKMVRLLMQHGAHVEGDPVDEDELELEATRQFTPLHAAAGQTCPNSEVIKILLEKGARVNRQDDSGNTALHHAAKELNYGVARMLLDAGARVDICNYIGEFPLHKTAGTTIRRNNDYGCDMMKLLLENSVNISVKKNLGDTSFRKASMGGSVGALHSLLTKVASSTSQTRDCDKPIRKGATSESVDVVVGTECTWLDIQTHDGQTPLHYATKVQNLEMVRFLLRMGASCLVKDNYGRSPLLYANSVKSPNVGVVQLFLEHGVDCNERDNGGFTPLHHAANDLYKEGAMVMLENGANVNLQDKRGYTPLHVVCDLGGKIQWVSAEILEFVKLLLDNGADPNILSNKSYTAIQLAKKRGHKEAVKILTDHSISV